MQVADRTSIEMVMDRVLDVLIEHGPFTAPYGEVLVRLAQLAFDDDSIKPGTNRYGATSRAVLRLEALGFVDVDRAHHTEAAKANVLLAIYPR